MRRDRQHAAHRAEAEPVRIAQQIERVLEAGKAERDQHRGAKQVTAGIAILVFLYDEIQQQELRQLLRPRSADERGRQSRLDAGRREAGRPANDVADRQQQQAGDDAERQRAHDQAQSHALAVVADQKCRQHRRGKQRERDDDEFTKNPHEPPTSNPPGKQTFAALNRQAWRGIRSRCSFGCVDIGPFGQSARLSIAPTSATP